jgi:thiamine-phosphate pyrophosphorylase
MFDSSTFTAGANRVVERAQARARHREADAAEPIDLLAALASETEGNAAALLGEFGLPPDQLAEVLGLADSEEWPIDDSLEPSPLSAAARVVIGESLAMAREVDRSRQIGTEHLLSGLLSVEHEIVALLSKAGLRVEELRDRLGEAVALEAEPIPIDAEFPTLDLTLSVDTVDLGRMLDASANRASEGLRVVEDYVRFVLDDAGLTRRLKEVRHRLGKGIAGLGTDLLINSRDTRGDVGTHIMTHTERVRENPRAVLTANFKRTGEAIRSLEEYGKLINVWIAGRFEVLRYDVYTLEKMVMTAVSAQHSLQDTRLMVLVGGLPTLGDLTWIVGEALAGGADVIQLREKNLPDRELLTRAREVRILTAQAKARFILNDRPDLARLAGADGVHVGQEDLSVRDIRRILGASPLIGVSTHDRNQLDGALTSGASYLGVGPIFPSPTKEFREPELAGLAFVETAAERTGLPWFAIGGITEANVERVVEAGAARIAVSSAVVRAERPRDAAANLKAMLG